MYILVIVLTYFGCYMLGEFVYKASTQLVHGVISCILMPCMLDELVIW